MYLSVDNCIIKNYDIPIMRFPVNFKLLFASQIFKVSRKIINKSLNQLLP